jgi:hypothetical protein
MIADVRRLWIVSIELNGVTPWNYRLGCETLAQLSASLTLSPKSNSSPAVEEAFDLVDRDITSKSSSPIALRKSASDTVLLGV